MAWVLLAGIFFVFGTSLWGDSAAQRQLVTIEVDIPKGIKLFEIQWLKKKTISPDAIAGSERVQGRRLQRRIPLKWRFFRTRSVSSQGGAGPWSRVHPIPLPQKRDKVRGLFRFVQSSAKQKRRFLRGKMLDIGKLAPDKATAYSVNGSDPRKLSGKTRFEADGHYSLQFHHDLPDHGPGPSAQSTIQEDFWVDITPPKTQIFIYPPFYQNEEGLWVGRNTRFALKAADETAGVDEIFFRLPQVKKWREFQRYSKESRLGDLELKGDELELRFYSRDKVGNSEEVRSIYLQADFQAPQLSLKEATDERLTWDVEDRSPPVELTVFQNGQKIHEVEVYTEYSLATSKLLSDDFTLQARDLLGNSSTYQGKQRR